MSAAVKWMNMPNRKKLVWRKKSSNDLRDPAKGEELEKSILSDATMLSSAGANS